ncbi:MAG TPA: DegQ family serine endoprotease [Candidatus Binataceae bacterium]|nr:DegQ family serine endoprotease [Candidatus Binataceae bacterium]
MKDIPRIAAAVALSIVLCVTPAAALQFPSNSTSQAKASEVRSDAVNQSHPAPTGAPEPNERIALPSWAPLVKRVMPTVVNVAITEEVKTSGFPFAGSSENPNGGQNPFGFGSPFGNPFAPFQNFPFFGQMPRHFIERGIGSGVIVSPDGYILTNYHVVGHANKIRVTLMDKREFNAKVIGTDPKTDLALIKINVGEPLPCASLGDSKKVEVGDWVIAIGNPFGFNLTVTAGIISAKGRALGGNYDNFIQTDASINPGNSGGPLFNTAGQVIGINSAIYSNTGSNAGIGFAIPIDLAKSVMNQLKEHGHVVRGWLGVEIQTMTPELAKSFGLEEPTGALVADVEKNSPAERAGVQRGDIIVKFNGDVVHNEHELPEMVAQSSIGQTVPLEIIRNGRHLTLHVRISELHQTEVASAERSEHSPAKWGLAVQTLTPQIAQELGVAEQRGVVVSGVLPDSPAADAGLQTGDVILRMDHNKVTSAREFAELARHLESSGKSALLLVQRSNQTIYTVISPTA